MKRTRFFISSLPYTVFLLAAIVMVPSSVFAQEASENQTAEAIEEVIKVEGLVTSRHVGRPNELETTFAAIL